MKYWCDSEIEHIVYTEGARSLPYEYPAAIIMDDNNYIEVEIVPGTCGNREYICSNTFETMNGVCIEMERRIWRGNGGMFVEFMFVPLEVLGYDDEPIGSLQAFDNAMSII